MKIIIIFVFVFLGAKNFAQTDSVKNISFSAGANYNIALGKNFLKEGYSNLPGYNLEFKISIRKSFLGFKFEQTYGKITNSQLIGTFDCTDSYNLNPFIGYRQNISNKLYLEHRIGIGLKKISNYSIYDKYSLSGNSIIIGSKLSYKITSNINFFTGLEFSYTKYKLALDGPYKDFYSKSKQINTIAGIKLIVWGEN